MQGARRLLTLAMLWAVLSVVGWHTIILDARRSPRKRYATFTAFGVVATIYLSARV